MEKKRQALENHCRHEGYSVCHFFLGPS